MSQSIFISKLEVLIKAIEPDFLAVETKDKNDKIFLPNNNFSDIKVGDNLSLEIKKTQPETATARVHQGLKEGKSLEEVVAMQKMLEELIN